MDDAGARRTRVDAVGLMVVSLCGNLLAAQWPVFGLQTPRRDCAGHGYDCRADVQWLVALLKSCSLRQSCTAAEGGLLRHRRVVTGGNRCQ